MKDRYHVQGATKWDKDLRDWVPDPDKTQPFPKEVKEWLRNLFAFEAIRAVMEYYDMEELPPESPNVHTMRWRHKASPK